jgi:hypothetical protein
LKVDGKRVRRTEDKKPFRRLSHSTCQVGFYLFITGGHDGQEYLNTTNCYNLGIYISFLSFS